MNATATQPTTETRTNDTKTTPAGMQDLGLRLGQAREFTMILPLKPGGAQNMRNRLKDYATSAVHLLDKVASVHDLRFVIFDNDTRLIFASTYDGGFEQYIKDFATMNSTSRTSRQLFRITSIKNFRIVKVTLASKALKFGITSPGTSRKQLSSIPLIRMPRSGRCGKGNECFTRSTSCWTRHSPKNRSDRSFIDHETSSNRRREEGRMKLFVAGLSHQTAPVELRELLAVESSQLVSCAGRLKRLANLDEIVFLSTCDRVEIYGTTPRLPRHIHSSDYSRPEFDISAHMFTSMKTWRLCVTCSASPLASTP